MTPAHLPRPAPRVPSLLGERDRVRGRSAALTPAPSPSRCAGPSLSPEGEKGKWRVAHE